MDFSEDHIFTEFRSNNQKQLSKLSPKSVELFDGSLIPANFTIVLRFPDPLTHQIGKLINQCKTVDNHQYYYPAENLHLTILGLINIDTEQSMLTDLIEKIIRDNKFTFDFLGTGSNKFAASVSAFPLGFSMFEVRKFLRNHIDDNNDDYSIHLPEYEYMGWINFVRYTQNPQLELIKVLKSNLNTQFGKFTANKIELYKNQSRILKTENTELIFSKDL